MVVDDSTPYDDWTRILTETPITYFTTIASLDIDIIAFDNMYSVCINLC